VPEVREVEKLRRIAEETLWRGFEEKEAIRLVFALPDGGEVPTMQQQAYSLSLLWDEPKDWGLTRVMVVL
jgi:hypothetical protein